MPAVREGARTDVNRGQANLPVWHAGSFMMGIELIHGPLVTPDAALPTESLSSARKALAKRTWSGWADDGTEFGFELGAPLRHGDVFWPTAAGCYVVCQ